VTLDKAILRELAVSIDAICASWTQRIVDSGHETHGQPFPDTSNDRRMAQRIRNDF
jgi:hypothetical protein